MLSRRRKVHVNYHHGTYPSRDWGIGRKPCYQPPTRAQQPFHPLPPLTHVNDPDYVRLRGLKPVLTPSCSYSDYIRGKRHGQGD